MKCFVYRASGNNPYENLAIEEFFTGYVSEHTDDDYVIAYFWQNEDSVIFGRNQNVENECRLEVLRDSHIHPVRRKTGGGAVFHDLENLNFSFVVSKRMYDKEKSMRIIQEALVNLGIPAVVNGRNDILVDGCKISGSAYASSDYMSLHHGTLLLAVNIEIMEQLLTVDEKKLASKGVRSVRSRVMNLKDYKPELSVGDYISAIEKAFARTYQTEKILPFLMQQQDLEQIARTAQLYASKEWIFGHSLNYLDEVRERFPWGTCTLQLIDAGEAGRYYQVFSDTLYAETIVQLQEHLDTHQIDLLDNILSDDLDDVSKQIYTDVFELIKRLHTSKE